MTITHTAFLRSLNPLERHYQVVIDNDQKHIQIINGTQHVLITLAPEYYRKLANLRLVTTEVEFLLTGFCGPDLALFWSRFDLCFRRGGG